MKALCCRGRWVHSEAISCHKSQVSLSLRVCLCIWAYMVFKCSIWPVADNVKPSLLNAKCLIANFNMFCLCTAPDTDKYKRFHIILAVTKKKEWMAGSFQLTISLGHWRRTCFNFLQFSNSCLHVLAHLPQSHILISVLQKFECIVFQASIDFHAFPWKLSSLHILVNKLNNSCEAMQACFSNPTTLKNASQYRLQTWCSEL